MATMLVIVFYATVDLQLSMEYARISVEMGKLTQVRVMMGISFQEMAAVQRVLSNLGLSARILLLYLRHVDIKYTLHCKQELILMDL